ncbi:hypothetical protein [Bacillus wiedmannii]|uniref:hypothetical protein n=1 Tax=Bacillus wiedmannii TaxID=1890302 RepID=UPI002E1E1C7A|nr:hypothetical protein [Bacillus wiedmannii]
MKKFISKALCFSFLAGAIGLGLNPIQSKADSNHGDKDWYMNFPSYSWADRTTNPSRPKYNSTSVYFYVKDVSGNYKVDKVVVRAKNKSGDYENCGTTYKGVGDGQTLRMINYAYEKFGKNVMVDVMGTSGMHMNDVHAKGVWSPDSI